MGNTKEKSVTGKNTEFDKGLAILNRDHTRPSSLWGHLSKNLN